MADSRKPAIEDADSREPAMKNADSPEPATKNADSKKPAKTATTKATPRNGDKTGCGHSAAHYPRSPRRAWLQEAVRGVSPVRPGTVATPATTSSTTHS